MSERRRKMLIRLATFLVLGGLLWWAVQNAPLSDILQTLHRLQLWQIAVLLLLNVLIYALITLRWWIIVQAEHKGVPYFPLLGVRVAVFGVSYFTFGPQVGGEPLQVLYLQRRHGLSFTRATASVFMDKLLEFLANFFLLAIGLMAIFQAGILFENRSNSLVSLSGLFVMMAWPPTHITLMMRGYHPLSRILRKISNHKFTRFIAAAEWMAGTFCRRHLKSLTAASLVSVLAAIGLVIEYFLMLSFLHIELPVPQTIAAWTAGWLAFLIPLPGGLGALEASQVFALGTFGISAAAALSVTILIRARDLLIGGLGLLFTAHGVSK